MFAKDTSYSVAIGLALLLTFWTPLTAMGVPLEYIVANQDADGDGIPNGDERQRYYTDPHVADTDGDGYTDGLEIANGYSPHAADTTLSGHDYDGDGMNDFLELAFKTDMGNPDTDGDGYVDGLEIRAKYDPRTAEPVRLRKRIHVDISEQYLNFFLGDVKMGGFLVSTGRAGLDTPIGTFAVRDKIPVHEYRGANYYYPGTKWNLRFHGVPPKSFLIHGAYWHDNWGTPMSGGCVNVSYEHMEGLYHWADVGTEVAIVP